MFIDEVEIEVHGGDGGNGCCSFRREKFVPFGGPDGGDGGAGGSVILEGSSKVRTFIHLRGKKQFRATRGRHGLGSGKTGAGGDDAVILMPPGTVIFDSDTGAQIGEVLTVGQRFVLVHGGRGGRGNARFKTSRYQAPRFSEQGESGTSRNVRLELKLLADVGLIGLPNAGKSTLLSHISRARPKIAEYPFTTLQPNLGVIQLDYFRSFVACDLPGLIEFAHQGQGLGIRFLRHVERTRVLWHLVDVFDKTEQMIRDEIEVIRNELREFNAELLRRPMFLLLTKSDLLGSENPAFLDTLLVFPGYEKGFVISAVSGYNLRPLLEQTCAVVSSLDDVSEIATAEQRKLISLHDKDSAHAPVKVAKESDGWRIINQDIVRFVSRFDIENDDAALYVRDSLKLRGVSKELRRAGAKTGDTILIGDYEFIYTAEDDDDEKR